MSSNANEMSATKRAIHGINAVEGFDPFTLAVEYTDLNTSEVRQRLPVMAQIAWYRLKYPEGRIAISVTPVKEVFVASVRVYKDYNDPVDCFLSEATASRKYDASKPTVSPREWAQTAAVGIALRNAGFGLQFHAAGESFDEAAADELGALPDEQMPTGSEEPIEAEPAPAPLEQAQAESTETPLERAMKMPCPITKDGLQGKTLGDLIKLDPKALTWIADKYTKNPEIAAGARLICEHALQASA